MDSRFPVVRHPLVFAGIRLASLQRKEQLVIIPFFDLCQEYRAQPAHKSKQELCQISIARAI